MALDLQTKALLDATAALNLKPFEQGTPDEARAAILERRKLTAAPVPPIAAVDERSVPGPAGPIKVRFYRPNRDVPAPTLVYFHGGGFVLCSLDTHDTQCREIANASGCLVASVDYRLAPEHKFPAAVDDCYAATAWIAANARGLGVDPSRLAVGGDSAGGNLAAAVTLLARARGGPALKFQLLIYPAVDASGDFPSYRENAEGMGLNRSTMLWFWEQYLLLEADAADPRASPLRAESLKGLPPALVITAERDVLRDEGELYADRLHAAGVETQLVRYPGLIHGFFGHTAIVERAKHAVEQTAKSLKAALT